MEALEKTLSNGYIHYRSRSHGRFWKKGETSGDTQRVRGTLADCDHDTLLFLVEQKGDVYHMGKPTCFYALSADPWHSDLKPSQDDPTWQYARIKDVTLSNSEERIKFDLRQFSVGD